MGLGTIWIGIICFCVGWHFYYQRKLAEFARQTAHKYCEENGIQFISIAKIKSRLVMDSQKGLRWQNLYTFEFSGDGESKYDGTLTLLGNKLKAIDTPVYRVG